MSSDLQIKQAESINSVKASVVLDSITENGNRVTTMQVTYPRLIHSEFMTYRVWARNAASSRAIPVQAQLDRIRVNPVIPFEFGLNKPGMQATETLSGENLDTGITIWLEAAQDALRAAERLMKLGVHKQVANRLLEPFMWITVIVTGCEWDNFFRQRCHDDAQPEIRIPAELMKAAYNQSTASFLARGDWHMPYIQPDEYALYDLEQLKEISAARCARVSYLTHEGVRDYLKDLRLYADLVRDGHWSPLEHVCTPHASNRMQMGCLLGFDQLRHTAMDSNSYLALMER